MNAILYIHGKGGSATESEHYKPLFPDCEVIGMDYFANEHHASLTIMDGGEHWFHTKEQLQFLDNWMITKQKKK